MIGLQRDTFGSIPHLLSLYSMNQMTCFLPKAFKIANGYPSGGSVGGNFLHFIKDDSAA